MGRKFLIVANWKANPRTLKEAVSLTQKIERGVAKYRRVEVVIAPPFPFIPAVGRTLKKSRLGAQNCFFSSGPYTGEVSIEQLKNMGVEYVMVGHSERKTYLGETDDLINKKVKALLGAGLKPILCVGEKERVGEEISRVIAGQLKNVLASVKKNSLKNLTVAYEPAWSISTMPGAHPDTADNVFRTMIYIRKVVSGFWGREVAHAMRVIYGGSVKSANIVYFLKEGKMEGALVGSASLDSLEFTKIVSEANALIP